MAAVKTEEEWRTRVVRMDTVATNEGLFLCDRNDLSEVCGSLYEHGGTLTTMTGLDLRATTGQYAVEYVFSRPASQDFVRIRAYLTPDDPEFPSVTPAVPAAHWYEREAKDMFGFIPIGHPDPRRLVLHETWPAGYHPLRKDVSATEKPRLDHRRFDYFEVHGEGIYELPVGPIHAGIIEPGHFRFSNIGELILHLDARLFYTHRGVEKIVEGKSFDDALYTVERTCGVCTVSHAVSFASAAERLTGTAVPPRAVHLRTLLLELQRIYNHVGDIGNICAGTSFHFGTAEGAILKERLQRLNGALTGHRFLMGVVGVGGMRYDIDDDALAEAGRQLSGLRQEFERYIATIMGTGSFVVRIEGPGILEPEIVRAFGGTGITARASGLKSDLRADHPHLLYPDLPFAVQVETTGDVASRLRVRAAETLNSFDMVAGILASMPVGSVNVPLGAAPAGGSALGYSESPRGANVHWLMADGDGRVERLRIRSAPYANWPLVARAVVDNVIPDFPLINKSFELCYACCDR
jgi:Ni,Fe-hydrogenase III large subunit/Ni,Fe-hydrogenase III component G